MSEVSFASLIVAETKEAILSKLLQVANVLGLVTESWLPGDPTRSLYDAVSRQEEAKEKDVVVILKAGFLELSSGNGTTLCARYLFDTERILATQATCSFELTNDGAEPFELEAGDVVALNPGTDKTYTSTTGGTLAPGGTLTVTIEADEEGSASSAGVGDIDELVTSLPKVSGTNLTAAVGRDEESDPALKVRARASLGALSPNGPDDAYRYVATTPDLVGGAQITDARVFSDSTNGDVTIYVRGASGAVDSPTVDLVQDGIDTWANPHNNEPTVISATNKTIAVTYQLWVYQSISEEASAIEARVSAALLSAMSERPIGGDVIPPSEDGFIYKGWIESVIIGEVGRARAFRASVSLPAADVAMDPDDVAILGTVTPTITFVEDP